MAVYVGNSPFTRAIYVSSVTYGETEEQFDEWEKNHFIIHVPPNTYVESTMNIVRNVLANGGANVVME